MSTSATPSRRPGCSWEIGNVTLSSLGISASDCALGLPPEAVAYLIRRQQERELNLCPARNKTTI